LKAYELLGGGAFLPVHWGTFSLALHAWDEPAETLFTEGPRLGAHLLMPRLGEAVEPAQAEAVTPWWRGVDVAQPGAAAPASAPAEPAVECLPRGVIWPMD